MSLDLVKSKAYEIIKLENDDAERGYYLGSKYNNYYFTPLRELRDHSIEELYQPMIGDKIEGPVKGRRGWQIIGTIVSMNDDSLELKNNDTNLYISKSDLKQKKYENISIRKRLYHIQKNYLTIATEDNTPNLSGIKKRDIKCKNDEGLQAIIQRHTEIINGNKSYKNIKNNILDGVFTNKFLPGYLRENEIVFDTKDPGIGDRIINITEEWYNMTNTIYQDSLIKNFIMGSYEKDICVYRWADIKGLNNGDLINHPLPFSCSFSLDFIYETWRKGRSCCLFKIYIDPNVKVSILEKKITGLEGHKKRKSDEELVLPPCHLSIQDVRKYEHNDNIDRIYICRVVTVLNKDEAIKQIRDIINPDESVLSVYKRQ